MKKRLFFIVILYNHRTDYEKEPKSDTSRDDHFYFVLAAVFLLPIVCKEALVIIGFTVVYYLLGSSFKPPLLLVNALGLSMTSFHGREFFPGVTQLNGYLDNPGLYRSLCGIDP